MSSTLNNCNAALLFFAMRRLRFRTRAFSTLSSSSLLMNLGLPSMSVSTEGEVDSFRLGGVVDGSTPTVAAFASAGTCPVVDPAVGASA